MRIQFNDSSFIECKKSEGGDKIIFTLSAKDYNNPLKKIVNSAELTIEEFKRLIQDV